MAIKCPKCGYNRGPGESAPAWQCPQCGVAYTKVAPAVSEWSPAPLSQPSPMAPPPFPRTEEIIFPDEMAVCVYDIKMPFWSMVVFMVKWAIASIPAFIILFAIGSAGVAIVGGFTKYEVAKAQIAQENAFVKRTEQAIKDKKVFIGMKSDDVSKAWGDPTDKSTTQFGGTRIETWRYGADAATPNQLVTITDGIVTSISGTQS